MIVKLHIGKITGSLLGIVSGLGLIGIIVGLILGSLVDRITYSKKIKKHSLFMLNKSQNHKIRSKIKDKDYYNIVLSISIISFFHKQIELKQKDLELIKWSLNKVKSIQKKDLHVISNLLEIVFENKEKINLNYVGKILKKNSISIDFKSILETISLLCNKKPSFSDFAIFSETLIPEHELSETIINLYPEKKENYTILGIGPGTDTGEIKKIFRKLAIQFHPDKLNALETVQKVQAKETFLKIKSAYEEIIKERTL